MSIGLFSMACCPQSLLCRGPHVDLGTHCDTFSLPQACPYLLTSVWHKRIDERVNSTYPPHKPTTLSRHKPGLTRHTAAGYFGLTVTKHSLNILAQKQILDQVIDDVTSFSKTSHETPVVTQKPCDDPQPNADACGIPSHLKTKLQHLCIIFKISHKRQSHPHPQTA